MLLVCVLCLVEKSASYRPKVRIGYELAYTPEKLAMHRGYFEKVVGRCSTALTPFPFEPINPFPSPPSEHALHDPLMLITLLTLNPL